MIENNIANIPKLEKIPDVKNTQSKEAAIKELNAFFISHFFKLMYETVDILKTDDAFSGGSGEKIFREFLINEYGKTMSDKFQLTNDMMSRYFQNHATPNISVES